MKEEKLSKMADSVRTGGKGTMRRKKKNAHKTSTDEKSFKTSLKEMGVSNTIPQIEEVNIFKEDVVIQFSFPKVQASSSATTWVVSGTPRTRNLLDILPQIHHQLDLDFEKLEEQSYGAEEDDDDDDCETLEAAARISSQVFKEWMAILCHCRRSSCEGQSSTFHRFD